MNLDKVMPSSISVPHYTNTRSRAENADSSVAVRTKHIEKVSLHDEKAVNAEAQEIETVVNKLNGFIDPLRTNLKFVFHEELNEYYVTVINPITNETVKEIPSRKMLDMYAAMAEFMGILIDKKI